MASGAAITIASINLHAGMTGLGQPYDVKAALTGLDADVIAVQEAWWPKGGPDARRPDPVAAAARELGARLIRTRLSNDISLADLRIAADDERGNWGIAVLSRLPVAEYETLSLGNAAGDPIRRGALICFVTAAAGWVLRLACTHLTPRGTSPAQLLRLTDHLAQRPARTVIAGDLNMPRLATWVAGGYTPTVQGRTFPANRPVIQLDHLLTGPGVTCLAAAVLPPVGSDHLPVRARFSPAAHPRRPADTELPASPTRPRDRAPDLG